jgi:hypothetical protein
MDNNQYLAWNNSLVRILRELGVESVDKTPNDRVAARQDRGAFWSGAPPWAGYRNAGGPGAPQMRPLRSTRWPLIEVPITDELSTDQRTAILSKVGSNRVNR